MPRLIQRFIVCSRALSVLFRWDHGDFPRRRQWFDHAFVRVISFVREQRLGFHPGHQSIRSGEVMDLSGGQKDRQGITQRIHQSVDFGTQATLAAPNRLIFRGFFLAPALCWWARTMVLSIIAYSLSASVLSIARMLPHTPFLAQRLHRRWVLFQLPKLSGRSRQGVPVRYRCITASTNRRLFTAVTPTEPARPGNAPLIRSHWSSRSWWGRMGSAFVGADTS